MVEMRNFITLKLIIIILLLVFPAGCAMKPLGPPPESITIAFSADNRAELYKCGCKSSQSGGLSRLGTAMKEVGPGAKVIIDCGNFAPASTGPFNNLKADAMIEGYNTLGYDAVNIGVNEINLGKDFILQADKELEGKMVSANVLDADGNLIVQPYLTKDFGSLRIGIIGLVYHQTHLTNPSRAEKSPVITREPIEALETYIPEMSKREKCDLIIVAGWLQQSDIEKIAEKFDGRIDMILTGYGFRQSERSGTYASYYKGSENPTPDNQMPVVKRDEENKVTTGIILHSTGNSGKCMGKLLAPVEKDEKGSFRLGKFEGATIELSDAVADDPEIDAILAGFHAKVRGNIDSMVAEVMSQNPRDYCHDFMQYVGSRWCSECHQNEHSSYSRSVHNTAIQSLNLKKEQNNPECLACHTTGYGEPGGFKNMTETYHLANVGCESCHGSAKEHLCLENDLKEAQKAQSSNEATQEQTALIESTVNGYDHKIRKDVPQEICLKCHTPEWDATFDYSKDLLLILHTAIREVAKPPVTTDVTGNKEPVEKPGEPTIY